MMWSFSLDPVPRIALEDPEFLVVEKPCGMHTAPLRQAGPQTLCDWVFARYPETRLAPAAGPSVRPAATRDRGEGGLLHRLDRDTSGLVLFARSPDAFETLLGAQEADLVEKSYEAIACRRPVPMVGSRPMRGTPDSLDLASWDVFLESLGRGHREPLPLVVRSRFRSYGPRGAQVACLAVEERPRASRRGSPDRIYQSWLERLEPLAPETVPETSQEHLFLARIRLTRGFRHQVRAHMAWIGLPLLGDPLYSGAEAPRLHLHASGISFPDPRDGHRVSITSGWSPQASGG